MMNKTFFSAACALVVLTACNSEQQTNGYHIEGSVADTQLEGETIYLKEFGSKTAIDSAVVLQGKFALQGTCDYPNLYSIVADNLDGVVATGAKAVVSIGEKIVVEQGPEVATIDGLRDTIKALNADFYEFISQNRDDKRAQYDYYNRMNEQIDSLRESLFAANTDNLIGAYIMCSKVGNVETLAQLDSVVALAPIASNLYPIKRTRYMVEQAENTAVGKPFVDFGGTDLEGNAVKLSDYVGKGNYVMVDFWASWCGPCRAEMPNLKKVYDKYKDKGLVLVGVNVWDKKASCIEAVEHEGMSWPIVYASHDNTATDSYGVRGIPTIVIFSPEGEILNRTVRGKKIMEFVDELYAE